MRRFRRSVLGASLLALALVAAACGDDSGGDGGDGTEEPKGSLTIGADNFAESEIVAEMYAAVLEEAGYDISTETGLTRETRIPSMEDGDIDVSPEYLATLLVFLDETATPTSDPAAVSEDLQPLLEERGLEVIEPSEAVDTNAFVVTQETADQFGLSTVSDLATVDDQLVLGGPPECPDRPFCIPGLQEVYGVEFSEFVPLDAGGPLTVEALDGGEIDVALLFSTQSVIVDKGWVVLEDDQNLQAADNITPLVNSESNNEEVTSLLNEVSGVLTTEGMLELNGRVEIDQEDPADVARSFLEEEGVLGGE